ncbi:muramoyltetrapeptide carboxypeptidase [Kribbella sp. VKM Ac-2527]|uniref:Muramoyltetrapeptide carboxypeptidase n=1 Tax=Kribbella caucasensis TaxID=2512215 RepID=A0A4R6J055_9ACTN|nr:LD-carboxypeptidase [Kribbella sp. VKM Ac-2527]TDO27495.1 muramoyltetrapeptide carboxypeptidase [Kribbella sp. VKM Ac-2527]
MSGNVIRPDGLRTGDRAIIVSSSSTIADRKDVAERARTNLESALGLRIDFADNAFAQDYYSAGTTEERLHDLATSFADPEIRAVFFSTGGATAVDLVDRLDYETIAANPKILAGLSDSSTLLNAVTAKTGMVTFHGFELMDFSGHEMVYTARSLKQVWFDKWSDDYHPNPDWRDLEGDRTTYKGWREIKPGRAAGTAVGGNSEAFMQLVGTEYCPPLDGAILFLEAYRLQKRHIQALLATLKLKGVPDSIHGLIIGYCLGSDTPGAGNDRDIADIILETTSDHTFPVIQVGEIGHQVENFILPIGAPIEIDTRSLSLSLLDPAVC